MIVFPPVLLRSQAHVRSFFPIDKAIGGTRYAERDAARACWACLAVSRLLIVTTPCTPAFRSHRFSRAPREVRSSLRANTLCLSQKKGIQILAVVDYQQFQLVEQYWLVQLCHQLRYQERHQKAWGSAVAVATWAARRPRGADHPMENLILEANKFRKWRDAGDGWVESVFYYWNPGVGKAYSSKKDSSQAWSHWLPITREPLFTDHQRYLNYMSPDKRHSGAEHRTCRLPRMAWRGLVDTA